MRKITTKKEQEKKQKKNNLIVGSILIVVLLLSTFGIMINSLGKNEDRVKYKGYDLIYEGGFWKIDFGKIIFSFSYSPEETTIDSPIEVNNFASYLDKPLYVQSNNYGAKAEIYRNFGQISSRIQDACLNETKCAGDVPIKTCNDNFIIIQSNESTEITQKQGCVFIRGPEKEIIKITDEFLYNIIGVK